MSGRRRVGQSSLKAPPVISLGQWRVSLSSSLVRPCLSITPDNRATHVCVFYGCRWATETRWRPWRRDSTQRHPSWANSTGSEVLSFTLANSCGYRWKGKVGQKAELPMHRARFLATITSRRMTCRQKRKVILISFSVVVLIFSYWRRKKHSG